MAESTDAGKAIGILEVLAKEFETLHGADKLTDKSSLEGLYESIHALPIGDKRAALCLSGGGIRSASFALGVLQGLAGKGLLDKFHYLSTVSGGGYIGAWLSIWRNQVKHDGNLMRMLSQRRKAEADRLTEVERAVKKEQDEGKRPKGELADKYEADQVHWEPIELSQLRANSNFLTPKLGAMSADTWTLVALYIRNLLLNWTVYLPLIVAVLLVPVLSADVLNWAHQGQRVFVDYHHGFLILLIACFVLAVFTSVRGRLARDSTFRVTQRRFLLLELLPIFVASMLVCVYSVGPCNVTGGAEGCWATIIGPSFGAAAGAAIYSLGWSLAFFVYGEQSSVLTAPTRDNPFPPNLLGVAWAVAGAVAGALVGFGLDVAKTHVSDPRFIVVFGVGWVAVSIFIGNALYLALTSLSQLGDVEREWLARSSGWFVAMTVGWGALSALVLYSGELIGIFTVYWSMLVGGGAGAVAARVGSSARSLLTFRGKPVESVSMTTVLSAAGLVFLVALAVVLSHAANSVLDGWYPFGTGHGGKVLRTGLVIVACAVLVTVFCVFVNVNRFSAHSLYRNRLIRAFLGSARAAEGRYSKTADPFTGFDQSDNVFVKDMAFPKEKPKLFPVINMALNTVAGANDAWQERKAESFIVTPLHSGNEWVKFWNTANYGGHENGLSLGTAIAISGAAASPNMGYHSSPLVGLIMTLFNVRLGWWLGNPSQAWTASMESPPFGMIQFIQELFGLTHDKSSFVYLSDGGHFENLGLYEMVRRRCHFIMVSDAGCDPDCAFTDLGNAARKIWIDLGAKITFKTLGIVKRKEMPTGQGTYCAVATIEYPERPDQIGGYILYVKPCFLGNESADIRAYASESKTFPHETTADQFFSESQMESYRALGAHIVETVLVKSNNKADDRPGAPIDALRAYWKKIEAFMDAPA